MVCRTDFSVAASGIYDVRAHAKGTHHQVDCREGHHEVYSVSRYRSRFIVTVSLLKLTYF